MRHGKPTYAYSVPTGGFPRPPFVVSMRGVELTARNWAARGPADFKMRNGPVQMARSRLVDDALEVQHTCRSATCPGRVGTVIDERGNCRHCGLTADTWTYDYALMHDDDLDVSPLVGTEGVLDAWLSIMQRYPDVGIIGACYMREAPTVPTLMVKSLTHGWDSQYAVGMWPNEPFEVDGIGTGFVLIRREVMQQLSEDGDAFQFVTKTNPLGFPEYVGEDYDFCLRARERGWRVIADPRVSTIHCKPSGKLLYHWPDWHAKLTDTKSPMNLNLGDGSGGSRLVERPSKTIDGKPFSMVVIDTYETKRRQAEEWAAKHAQAPAAEGIECPAQ